MQSERPITLGRIFVFWVPLASTWLMMSVEGPFLAAVIARLPDPKFNLAAWGVAFAVALIVEAPIIMILSAATALVRDAASFRKLRNYTYAINGLLIAGMLALALSPAWPWVAGSLLGLPDRVAELTRISLLLLLPWPPAIGYRRFFQGLLIRYDLTRRVAYGTVIRVVAMAGSALALYHLSEWPGVYVGAAAMSAGVLCEALASRLMAQGVVRKILATPPTDEGEPPLGYRRIHEFYYPLALTSMIGLAVHPLVTFFMGHARLAIESLAVLPVIHALSFIFRSAALSYQEVGITMLARDETSYPVVARFAWILAAASTLGMCAIAFTPLSDIWFRSVSGLSPELARFAALPTMIMGVFPALSVLLVMQRIVLVHNRETVPITWSTALELCVIFGTLFLTIQFLDLVGAVAAMIALIAGRLFGIGYLIPAWRRGIRRE